MIDMSEKQKFIKKLEAEQDAYAKRMREYMRRILEIHESEKLTVSAKDRLIKELDDILQYDLGKYKKIEKLIEDIILL